MTASSFTASSKNTTFSYPSACAVSATIRPNPPAPRISKLFITYFPQLFFYFILKYFVLKYYFLHSSVISYHRSRTGDSYFHKKLRRITGNRILRSFFIFIFILERGSLLGTYFKDSSIFQGYSIPYGVRHPFRQ